jgi:uncharacterized membrane protein YdjX (TVP38/TMEM64 family)
MLAVAVVGAVAFRDQLSFDALARHRDGLTAFRDHNFLAASIAFILAYALIVAFSLPGATIATLTGGFLFGMFPGTLYNVVAAATGAVAVFLAARAGFGGSLAEGLTARGGAAARLRDGLEKNEWSVLFLMRLVPVVPFFLANLIPAFLGVSVFRFAVTTFFGIIPAALVFTSVGSGLAQVFASGQTPDPADLLSPHMLGPLLGLAVLAALPILIRLWRGRLV